MKKISPLFLVAGLLIMPLVTSAAEFRAGDEIQSIGSTGDLYLAGGKAEVTGDVGGDLIITGGDVVVSGSVASDLIAAGGEIILTAPIGDDLRIAGGTITIEILVQGDVIVAGGEVILKPGGSIEGDVIGVGGEITIESPVKGNVRVRGGKITLNSDIQGNVAVKAGELVLGEKALIHGDLSYRTEKEATMAVGAKVNGKIDFKPLKTGFILASLFAFGAIIKFLMILTLSLVFVLNFKSMSGKIIHHTRTQFGKSLLHGIILMILMPICIAILFATIIGVPIAMLLLFGYISLWILSSAFGAMLVGTMIVKWTGKKTEVHPDWKNTILGVVVLMLLSVIPFIGWIAQCIILTATFGAIAKLWYASRIEKKEA